jgi:hypothetical protein
MLPGRWPAPLVLSAHGFTYGLRHQEAEACGIGPDPVVEAQRDAADAHESDAFSPPRPSKPTSPPTAGPLWAHPFNPGDPRPGPAPKFEATPIMVRSDTNYGPETAVSHETELGAATQSRVSIGSIGRIPELTSTEEDFGPL